MTLAQELATETDRLAFRFRNLAMHGRAFTMQECQRICEQRDAELKALAIKGVDVDVPKESLMMNSIECREAAKAARLRGSEETAREWDSLANEREAQERAQQSGPEPSR